MGQCSTLPAEGRSGHPTKPTGTDSSMSMKADDAHHRYYRQPPPQHPKSGKNFLQVETQSVAPQPSAGQNTQMFSAGVGQPTQGPELQGYETADPEPMEEDLPLMMFPPPPAVAVRTRCYRLNLDSDLYPQSAVCLGPFQDEPPPLTYSDSSDSSAFTTPVQVAIQTAKIFRGITVAKDGTILSQNARATRSNGRATKNKRGEKSRQATKIDKAKDLVEESILTGKAPDTDEPANMVSLVIMGEYDGMKQLVRDGAKKLRDAAKLPDDSLLSVNQLRESGTTSQDLTNLPSPRKRLSRGGPPMQAPPSKTPGGSIVQQASGTVPPPKLKSHPRDRPSSRRFSSGEEKRSTRDFAPAQQQDDHSLSVSSRQPATPSANGGEGADWSNALSFSRGFHSLWNCGGTGEETATISPTAQLAGSPKNGGRGIMPTSQQQQQPYRPMSERRDSSNFAEARESGVTARAN